jgi:hypothetical protein
MRAAAPMPCLFVVRPSRLHAHPKAVRVAPRFDCFYVFRLQKMQRLLPSVKNHTVSETRSAKIWEL